MNMVRDIGEQLLYYGCICGERVSAPSIMQLLDAGVPMRLNCAAIPAFLMYQYSIGGNTLFGNIGVSQWDQIKPVRNIWTENESVLIRRLRELVRGSIIGRTAKSQQISLLLSGGVDSSAVGAIATGAIGNKVRLAFTATFDSHSELDKAVGVAEFLKLKLREVRITAKMVAQDIENITAVYEEPLGDAALINNYFLYKAASSVSDTVLCGDGGDEIFGGYPWHRYAKYIPLINRAPMWLRRIVQGLVIGDPTTCGNRLERVLLFPAQLNIDDMILYPTTAMSYQNIKWLLKSDICNYDFVSPNYKDIYGRMLAMDCLNLLPGKFGMKANKFSPPAVCSPLINKDIASFAFGLPAKLRRDKYILRKAVEGILPSEIVWGRKAGFGTPIAEWLNSDELKPMVLDRLRNGRLLNEICKKRSLGKIAGALESGKVRSTGAVALGLTNVIWGLFALQVWYDVWFGKIKT